MKKNLKSFTFKICSENFKLEPKNGDSGLVLPHVPGGSKNILSLDLNKVKLYAYLINY